MNKGAFRPLCCIHISGIYNHRTTRVHVLALGLHAMTGWTQAQSPMNTVFHPADSRGQADHGWLDTYHSFSFASWHNPERMHFGAKDAEGSVFLSFCSCEYGV